MFGIFKKKDKVLSLMLDFPNSTILKEIRDGARDKHIVREIKNLKSMLTSAAKEGKDGITRTYSDIETYNEDMVRAIHSLVMNKGYKATLGEVKIEQCNNADNCDCYFIYRFKLTIEIQ